jgi:hypothetical protein
VLELEHRLGVERGCVVEGRLLDVLVRRPSLDGVDAVEHPPLGSAAQQQPGAKLKVADQLAGDQHVALGGAEGVERVAELAVAPVALHLENALHVPVVRHAGGDDLRLGRRVGLPVVLAIVLPVVLAGALPLLLGPLALALPPALLRVAALLPALPSAVAVVGVTVAIGSLHGTAAVAIRRGKTGARRRWRARPARYGFTRFVVVGRWAGCGMIGRSDPSDTVVARTWRGTPAPVADLVQPANPPRCDATRLRLL